MRIHQGTGFAKSLLQQVLSGQMAPAAFQRPYVWGKDDVLKLGNSILAGYPIGGFLSWIPPNNVSLADAGRHRLGPCELETCADRCGTSLLLDGQNRLATLAWMKHDFTTPLPEGILAHENETWNGNERMMLDLELNEFVWLDKDKIDKGLVIPAWSVFEGGMREMRNRWDGAWKDESEEKKDEAAKNFDKATDAFNDARVTHTVLENATAQEAKRAFLHICKVGVPMSENDFDLAVQWEGVVALSKKKVSV